MSKFVNRFATPLTSGLFAISAVSGVALFFHWIPGTFHSMHVWLSMVLLLPVILHIWKNWTSFLAYARRRTLIAPLVLCVVVAIPFAYPGSSGGGNPAQRMAAILIQARLSDLAPVLKTTPDALVATLEQRGLPVRSADETLREVAAASGKPSSEILFAVFPAR